MSAQDLRGRLVPHLSAIVMAASALSIIAALLAMKREAVVEDFESLLEQQSGILARGDALPPVRVVDDAFSLPARALLADTAYLARSAAVMPRGPARDRLLAKARSQAWSLTQRRAHWGEAWVVLAYIEHARRGFDPLVRGALLQSYADAPLLRDAGPWRVQQALDHWDALSAPDQDRVVQEIVWLLQVSPEDVRLRLFEMARQSPAYRTIFLRWRLFGRN